MGRARAESSWRAIRIINNVNVVERFRPPLTLHELWDVDRDFFCFYDKKTFFFLFRSSNNTEAFAATTSGIERSMRTTRCDYVTRKRINRALCGTVTAAHRSSTTVCRIHKCSLSTPERFWTLARIVCTIPRGPCRDEPGDEGKRDFRPWTTCRTHPGISKRFEFQRNASVRDQKFKTVMYVLQATNNKNTVCMYIYI